MNPAIALAALALLLLPGSGEPGSGGEITGMASQYAPGVMERVIAVRQAGRTAKTLPQDLGDYSVFVAVEDCTLVGEELEIRPADGGAWERALVCDCSGHAETSEWMLVGGILVEVDFQTAARWGTVGRGIRVVIRAVPASAPEPAFGKLRSPI